MKKEDPSETWRVFCAVELEGAVRKKVLQHITRLREAVPDAKASWARDENLHLTLKFLGEIPQTKVPSISDAARRATEMFAPFTIRIEQSGVFPTHGPPRVLWLGITDPEKKLSDLHARLEDEVAQAGFPKETRPFHPHLTIARLRQPQHARILAAAHKEMEFEPAEIGVSELLVIRSELRSEGSKYTVVSRHRLGVTDQPAGKPAFPTMS